MLCLRCLEVTLETFKIPVVTADLEQAKNGNLFWEFKDMIPVVEGEGMQLGLIGSMPHS